MLGNSLIVIGVILVAVFALADPLNIGQAPGFGWKQLVGVVVGAGLIGAGWFNREK